MYVNHFSEVVSRLHRDFANKNGIVVFEFEKSLESQIDVYSGENDMGYKKSVYPMSVSIEAITTVSNKSGTRDQVRYCENFIPSDDRRPAIYNPVRIKLRSHMSVSLEKDADLAYFLFACSPHCVNGLNRNERVTGYFHIKDETREARERITASRNVDRARFLISNEEGNGGLSEDKIRVVAESYGMAGAMDVKDGYVVRVWLKDYVDKLMRHDKFIIDIGMAEVDEFAEIVKKAQQLGFLEMRPDKGNTKRWFLVLPEGEDNICSASFGKGAEETLTAYLRKNPDTVAQLKALVG